MKFISDQWRDMNSMVEYLPRYSMPGDGIVFRGVRRAEIADCDIYCDKKADSTLFFIFSGEYIRMANCRINGSGWAVFGGDRCIFEKNDAWNCTYSIASVARNLFWSRNRQFDLFTNNRESVTHDGAKTAFYKGLATGSADGTRVTLSYAPEIQFRDSGDPGAWVGYDLQIAEGRGVGQTRTITAMDGWAHLTVDRPFDIAPDATSLFVIAAERRRLLYLDSDTEDSDTAIQLYGGATDCVVARNRCRRTGGFQGSGRDYHGVIPCWFVQFLGNVVEIGNTYRSRQEAVIGAFLSHGSWALSQSYVLRDNVIESNGSITLSVMNGLVERNTVRRSDTGISSLKYQETLCLFDNVFEDVDAPYANVAAARILPPPADLAGDALRRMKAGTLDLSTRRARRRYLGLAFRFQPWNVGMRNAHRGAGRTFTVPATVTAEGLLGPMITSVSATIPEQGGWTFRGPAALTRTPSGFTGTFTVNPPKGYMGFSTFAVKLRLAGDGWSHETAVDVKPLEQNRILDWRYALVDGVKEPPCGADLPWTYEMQIDPHERMLLTKTFGDALKGKSFLAACDLVLAEGTTISFMRGEPSCTLSLDGVVVVPPGTGVGTLTPVPVAAGRHVLHLFQPAETDVTRPSRDCPFVRAELSGPMPVNAVRTFAKPVSGTMRGTVIVPNFVKHTCSFQRR